MTTINGAIQAYRTTAQRPVEQPKTDAADGAAQPSFGQMVKQAVTSAIDTTKQSESASMDAVMGKADITQVAQAVTNADVTLQGVVAVRDKIISAYQQIMQMPI